jgi:hypothetical protein
MEMKILVSNATFLGHIELINLQWNSNALVFQATTKPTLKNANSALQAV